MNRAEFEQKIMEHNLMTFYDGHIYPPFDDGWRTYTKVNEYVNEAGLYGVYKDTDGKWIYYITEYNDRGPQMRYRKQCDTEHEAFEQLFEKVMRFKATTNRKRAESKL